GVPRRRAAPGEHEGGVRSRVCNRAELLLEQRVPHREDGQVHGPADVANRRVAAQSKDLVVLRIDRIDVAYEAAFEELDQALVPHRTLADARPHDGDGPRLEHGLERAQAFVPRARRTGHAWTL